MLIKARKLAQQAPAQPTTAAPTPTATPAAPPTPAAAPQVAAPAQPTVLVLPTSPISPAEQAGEGAKLHLMTPGAAAASEPAEVESPDGDYHVGPWVVSKHGTAIKVGHGNVPSGATKLPSGKAITVAGPDGLLHLTMIPEPKGHAPEPLKEVAPSEQVVPIDAGQQAPDTESSVESESEGANDAAEQ